MSVIKDKDPDELREAVATRIEWMILLGCDDEEILESIHTDVPTSLQDEVLQLEAAKRLGEISER
jgi:hypothetical protein